MASITGTPGTTRSGTLSPRAPRALAPRSRAVPALALAGGVVAPIAAGLAVRALARSNVAGAITTGGGLALAGVLRWQLARLFVDEPPYTLEQRLGELEIRRYGPFVEARTEVRGDYDGARREGFHRLFEYLRGANWGVEKLTRVAPADRGVRLPMTAPVLMGGATGAHTVAFVMEPGRARADLPEPHDDRIQLVDIPARRLAVLRFRGDHHRANVATHEARALELVDHYGFTRTGGLPRFAHYDPPSTLPLLRRNEVWVEIG